MAKRKRRVKVARPTPYEHWGKWEDRSHMLVFHTNPHMYAAYANRVFAVQMSLEPCSIGDVIHLWIMRADHEPILWRDGQRIKNELIGPERTAIEIYPPESQLVDSANMYHLFVLPEGYKLPVEWIDR